MGNSVTGSGSWRKSSASSGEGQCVEVRLPSGVRDSKNPGGPALWVDPRALVELARSVGR